MENFNYSTIMLMVLIVLGIVVLTNGDITQSRYDIVKAVINVYGC